MGAVSRRIIGQGAWCRLAACGVLAVIVMVGSGCRAAEPADVVAAGQNLPALLATATVLSDDAMSQQTGTGLQAPKVGTEAIGRQPMLLWDEMRPKVPIVPSIGNDVTITISGPGN